MLVLAQLLLPVMQSACTPGTPCALENTGTQASSLQCTLLTLTDDQQLFYYLCRESNVGITIAV